MPKLSIKLMVVKDLGYCCPWFFFKHFRKTGLIAARLGVTERAVRYIKAEVRSGEETCKNCATCLHAKVTLEGNLRKKAFNQ
jgi:hypothetical protein